MLTPVVINGQIEDAQNNPLNVVLTFTSASTPQVAGQVLIANTVVKVVTDPADGTFSVALDPGAYSVVIGPQGLDPSTTVTILVPSSGPVDFGDIVTTALPVIPGAPANTLFNGLLAGELTFLPLAALAPTYSEVAYSGGNIDSGSSKYTYWLSYVNAVGETILGPKLDAQDGQSSVAQPNKAILLTFPTLPAGVTAVHVWRTTVDPAGPYDMATFPANVDLLATVAPSANSYTDFESYADFVARAAGVVPPIYNTTSGQVCSSPGKVAMVVSDQGVNFPGTNVRVVPGVGLQLFNFTTLKWYTILNVGNPPGPSADAGNSSYNQNLQ